MPLVTDPEWVARHGFYPLITFTRLTRRYDREARKVVARPRTLAFAAHLDAHVFAWYAHQLSARYEAAIAGTPVAEAAIAYRGRGWSHLRSAREAFAHIRGRDACVALAFDVEAFFDTLDHALVKQAWAEALGVSRLPADHHRVYRAVTHHAGVTRQDLAAALAPLGGPGARRWCGPEAFRRIVRGGGLVRVNALPHGLPQGVSLSTVLSNLVMRPFDEAVAAFAAGCGGWYRRYADDVLLVVPPAQADAAAACVRAALAGRRLQEATAKFDRVTFSRGPDGTLRASRPLQYLGFLFDGRRVLVRPQSLARYQRRLKRGIRGALQAARRHEARVVFKRQLLARHSHLGRRTFVRYVLGAARLFDEPAMRRQVRRHMARLRDVGLPPP